jgi:hypothetical protein
MIRTLPPPLFGAALALLAPAPASALRTELLWATVNICDTSAHPNMIGVRASMPGNRRRQRMYMRFSAEFFSEARRSWRLVHGSGRSRWMYVGSSRYRSRQAGFTFSFDPPAAGGRFLLRGAVDFQWRARKRARHGRRRARWAVARRAHRVTHGGFSGVAGGDPPGSSLGSCSIL